MATYQVRMNRNIVYECEVEAPDEDAAVELAWAEVDNDNLAPELTNDELIWVIRPPEGEFVIDNSDDEFED